MPVFLKGATSKSLYFEALDSTSTTGGRKTGLAFNTAGLTATYARSQSTAVAIALVTQTAGGAWASGGFAEVDATLMPGIYRLDVPDAAFAAGAGDQVTVTLRGAAGMAQVSTIADLVAYNPQNAASLGLTNLDAAVTSRMATYTQPTGFLAATFPTTVASPTNITAGTISTVNAVAAGGITAASVATGAIDADALATDAVTEIADGILTSNINGSGAANSGATQERTVRAALRMIRNKWDNGVTNPGFLTVFKEDDVTLAWTSALATNATAEPIISSDPT